MTPMFYLLAVLTVGGAVAAVSLRQPVHCALSLVVAFVGLAGFYLGLGAQFVGLAQVLVYVGAVAILLVFVMLLTRGDGDGHGATEEGGGGDGWRVALTTSGLVVGLLGAAIAAAALFPRPVPSEPVAVRRIGEVLMSDYVVPLQGVGILLTAALIGAGLLALPSRRGRPGSGRSR